MPDNSKPRIAIACEGGGSHAAFTSGVLQRLLREQIEIVALSGTSGGAVCAMLAWRGLLDASCDDAIGRLRGFWRDNVEKEWWEKWGRMVGEVFSPEVSPYWYPWADARNPFREMLERHCGFAKVPDLLSPSSPRLLISAVDVKSGRFTLFPSHPFTQRDRTCPAAKITADVILASAAVPTVFRPVKIDDHEFWDGVFSQNPPIRELPDMVRTLPGEPYPDEIWVVRINPRTRATVPKSLADIRDRRNELAGIISLSQELYFIDYINWLVEKEELGKVRGTKHRRITLRSVAMEEVFASRLSYESKSNRSPDFIKRLEKHGESQAEEFLRNPKGHLEEPQKAWQCVGDL